MVNVTGPRPDGTHRHHTDRGYGSVTRYFDDGSQVMVAHQDYAGSAVEWRPRNHDSGRTARIRGIWWEDNDLLRAWIILQADAMPDHIWAVLVAELPHLDLTPRSSP